MVEKFTCIVNNLARLFGEMGVHLLQLSIPSVSKAPDECIFQKDINGHLKLSAQLAGRFADLPAMIIHCLKV